MKRSSFLKSLTLALTSLFIPKVTKELTGHIKRIEVDGEVYLNGGIWEGIDGDITYTGSWASVSPKAQWRGTTVFKQRAMGSTEIYDDMIKNAMNYRLE